MHRIYACIYLIVYTMKYTHVHSAVMWSCYIIESTDGLVPPKVRTYVGCTTDPARRLGQHNRMTRGGAKSTAGRQWRFAAVLKGLPDRVSAMQFEYAVKRFKRNRVDRIVKMFMSRSVCSKCAQMQCQHKWQWDALQLAIESRYHTVKMIPYNITAFV